VQGLHYMFSPPSRIRRTDKQVKEEDLDQFGDAKSYCIRQSYMHRGLLILAILLGGGNMPYLLLNDVNVEGICSHTSPATQIRSHHGQPSL
jgi:hypothetical protein